MRMTRSEAGARTVQAGHFRAPPPPKQSRPCTILRLKKFFANQSLRHKRRSAGLGRSLTATFFDAGIHTEAGHTARQVP
jgi:hypothetical protein